MNRIADEIASRWRFAVALCRRMVGIPDYDAYVAHLRLRHPERPVPDYATFFAERQRARYRAGGGRCC